MPNPRAQRPLSLQAVTEDIRSLAQPAEALLDMLAGAAKGSVTATAGIGGDLESLARGLAAAYRAPSGQRMDAFAGGMDQPTVLPTTQKISDMLPAVVPTTAPLSRQHTAEYGQGMGEFIPTPGSGKVVKGGLSMAGQALNDRLLAGQSLTPFLNTPAPITHVINPNDIKSAGRALFESQTPERLLREAEAAEKLAAMPPRSKAAVMEMGLYHPVGGGLKLSKPTWAMHSTTVPDPEFKQPPISIITPEQLVKEQAALFPLVGDRAAAGRYLTHVGDKELERPVRLTGGPRYMDANYNPMNPEESAAWESGLGRVTALGRQAERAGEGGRPVYGIYTAGSGTNTDFNVMGANALLQQIPHSKISKKAEREFDRAMREGSKKFDPIPDWPGIRSPKAEEMLLDKSKGIVRTKFFDTMGKENFQSMGFPEVAATRKSIIEPELLDIPTNQAGYRLARMDTTGRIIENPTIPSDYPKAMAGQVAGTLDVPADYKDIFQSHFDARRFLGQPESGDYYSFSRAHPIQYADEEWLNRLMEQRLANERKIKEGSYEEGGAVHVSDNPDTQMMEVAGGGAITGAAVKAMERLKELKAEAALKADVWKAKQAADEAKYTQDIQPMTPEMMKAEIERMQNPVKKAAGGEITADDLILEERPL